MNTADKIASLKARRDDAFAEAMRVGGLADEAFGQAEELAYNALLERIDACNEYIKFLIGESHVKPRNRKKSCALEVLAAH